ncbi:hypothetical protein PHSY_005945 [Pseudozyma hubeiensis SY62]|uniref:Uncharacterized protein n=1 Tax=Pseudozyma hubeiensis (strain SY62) TaxID=1305764 RepID=R9PAW1_PSEHS|nr:hypothetical protein PHSY_005945 [Pseudozyma hubeiensis SY62]GAC98352.1 hypothetical protein PHSY_005945 [Pseudozyma hubeiensis SY62]
MPPPSSLLLPSPLIFTYFKKTPPFEPHHGPPFAARRYLASSNCPLSVLLAPFLTRTSHRSKPERTAPSAYRAVHLSNRPTVLTIDTLTVYQLPSKALIDFLFTRPLLEPLAHAMSSFYASRKSFDVSDRSVSHDPASHDTVMQRPTSACGHHSNASSASFGSGGAPMHAMMVPGNVVPTLDRPDSDSPFSDWEAYIVKQAQDWSDKSSHMAASPSAQSRKSSGPRIVWADQVRKSSPQTQPLVYTKARDRFAPPVSPEESSPPTNSRNLLRRPSFDMLRPRSDASRTSPPPQPEAGRPSISSPIMTRSTLTTAQPDSVEPWQATMETPSAASFARASPDPLQVPQNESQVSSVCGMSPLALSLPGDDFSSLLLSNFAKRASTSSTSSGRAPGPCELIAEPLPALFSSETSKPPSIASTYSMHSRRASWASSIDLDPALICTPPLSSEGSQEQSRSDRPAFLAEYGLDHDTEESDTECSHYADEHEELAAMPSLDMGSPQTPKDHELPPQPVFQRLEADLISLHENDNGNTQRFTPDGRPLPLLDLSSLPREKQDTVLMARARLLSPTSFKKAFSLRSKGSHSGSRSSVSSPSLNNSSSEEVGKVSESAVETPTVASIRDRLPSLVAEDMTQWAAGVPREAPPASLLDGSNSTMSHAPSMQMSPSLDSFAHTMSSAGSSAETPLSPAFSYSGASIASESSRGGPSSILSSGQRKHRVGTPGLTKKAGADAGATASLDPHLARYQTRARSSGSISSQTPSTSSAHRRASRKSGRSRITDGMPSFADMASTLAVPVSNQRRFSARSLSSEGSIDSHSNASNGSSFAKVGGSSDDGLSVAGVASTTSVVKSVLRKRVPSLDGSLLSPRKEVSFELPVSAGFGTVDEEADEEEQELLEHEQRQRSHLVLPPMKLQAKQSAAEQDASDANTASRKQATQDDLDITRFLDTFGRDIKTVESLELLDNVHSGSSEWPRRQDWDSMPAYLAAYATTFLSRFADDSATLVYSDDRAPAPAAGKTVSAPLLSKHPVYTSMVRSVLRIASWEQPLVSAGISSFYALSLAKGKLVVVLAVGLALLAATEAAQSKPTSSSEAEELQEAYSKIASVLLGSAQTHERMRNLALWRSPKASLRFTGLLLALAVGASRFASGLMSLPGLFIGLAVFVWLPSILNQPEWAPTWLKQGNPVDVLLYDVPTDAQHAILTLRRRAASGEQLVHRSNDMSALSTTKFDHRVSASELQHAGDVVDGAYFAHHEGEAGHVVVLAHRVIFRTLAGMSEGVVTLKEELERDASMRGCKITFDSRLEKVVRLDKTEMGLELRLKNGKKVVFDDMVGRDEAFARLVALAPQKWH